MVVSWLAWLWRRGNRARRWVKQMAPESSPVEEGSGAGGAAGRVVDAGGSGIGPAAKAPGAGAMASGADRSAPGAEGGRGSAAERPGAGPRS